MIRSLWMIARVRYALWQIERAARANARNPNYDGPAF